ncbi:MAG: F0F1 ATP synthase subunit epsilon [Deltaproteobacteria bacterium]|nr:F0F1 ATP synthase subunit epsilon [Deltaproteobacteria bacterium]
MSTFTLVLQDATQTLAVEGVRSFVGEDHTGQFGILANHTRMMTLMSFGLARFTRDQEEGVDEWEYLALPGGVLYFLNNRLTLSTSHFLMGGDKSALAVELETRLRKELEQKREFKESLKRLEQEMFRRLWKTEYEP